MSNKIRKLENRRKSLIRNIQLCEYNKKKIVRYVQKLDDNYDKGLISYEEYYLTRNKVLEHKTIEQWINYYNGFIEKYRADLIISEKETKSERKIIGVTPLAIIFSMLLVLGLVAYYMGPSITGFAVFNETVNITETNVTETNVTEIPVIIDTGMPNLTINVTKIDKWYSAKKQDLKEEGTSPGIINETGVDAIIIDSRLLTEDYAFVYSEPIIIDKNNYKIKLDYKMLKENMNDSVGEMVIDYYNETDLVDTSVIEFNETNALMTYGYEVGLDAVIDGDWTRLEININNQKDIKKIRIGISHNMGLDYSLHYYLIKEIELK